MTKEKETLRRVQDGLFHLQKAIQPFIAERMEAKLGKRWIMFASRAQGSGPLDPLDGYGLLKTMIDQWRDVFDDAFARNEKFKVRNFLSTAFDARNATSHLALPLTDAEALRYLDAMVCLARAVKGPKKDIEEIEKLYGEQRRDDVAKVDAGIAPATPAPVPEKPGTLSLGLDDAETPAGALRPWIEIAFPHPDVLANRYKQSEFAADLAAVYMGQASDDYATPENFFRITFLTEGLQRVLRTALERLTGRGGDPVLGLQTSFGGGKTHTMLALYHLANATDPAVLAGVSDIADTLGIDDWKPVKTAIFVGTAKGVDSALVLRDGPKVRTLWGYIAWRLAGKDGLELVREAEAAGTNPGSELMVEVFRKAGPSVILLDEVVAFARQLPDERFEAFLSFIQSLTEAVKMLSNVLLVGSLPESKLEAGGEKGVAALQRLEKVFGRTGSPWLAAHGNETYEIVRRRLFQQLDAEGEKARDETVKAFHDFYRKNAAEFPAHTKEARYAELLRLSYPIHPELFERLSKDWSTLPNFQRTRGVLRFMANVVSVLWQARARDPLILPGRVPIADERVKASVIYPLDPAYSAVVDSEVDGEGSLPARMEANPSRRLSQARAATRTTRSIFLCSAPTVGQPHAGLSGQAIRLAAAEPGDQIAIFGEALRELHERATYLYEEAGRYWFSTQPTLNRLADERATALPAHEVDAEILRVLITEAGSKANFARVHAAPDDPATVDEAAALSLVLLGPASTHTRAAKSSPAIDAATDALTRCRTSQRRYRNTLIFAAPDEALLATAREVVRKALAWASINNDRTIQGQLTQAQAADVKEKAKSHQEAAEKAVRSAWTHILYAEKDEAKLDGRPFEIEQTTLMAKDRPSIAASIYEKISPRGDSIVKDTLGPKMLMAKLDSLWPVDKAHLAIADLREWFASYVYLPKLRDPAVLESAIAEGVSSADPLFGYADGYDEATGQYVGPVYAKLAPTSFSPGAVIVRKDVAAAQAQKAVSGPGPTTVGLTTSGPTTTIAPGIGGPETPPPAPGSRQPARFYGSVEIDMVRPVKSFDTILNAVVMELQRTQGAKVKLTLEIAAEAPGGFPDSEVSVVRDNAKQLKFKAESTGFEE
ncbi:DUF499 domain-containing protein [Mesorhizobium sp. M0633]|uniref:DUF499 domain-containing protein n=1 Tax=Mesorhizobium sp. M0633 TaxID=2956977 RepID=UPI00333954AE